MVIFLQIMETANDIEKRILAKMEQGAERIGYSIKEQQKDKESGMSDQEIIEKCERYAYIYNCIKSS